MSNRPITSCLGCKLILKCNLVVDGETRPYISSMRNGVRQRQSNRGISWSGIGRTLLVEILVSLALLAPVVRYVECPSAPNHADFIRAPNPSPSRPNPS